MDHPRHATHTAVTVHHIWRESVRSGLADAELRRLTGLDPAELTDFAHRVPAETLFSVWETVVRRLDDPAFPLRVADAAAEDARSAVYLLAASYPKVRDGIVSSVANSSAWTTAYTLATRDTDDGGLAVVLDGLDLGRLGARCEAEFQLADFVRCIRAELDGEFTPARVTFAHPAPRDIGAHRAYFGPGLAFGARRSELVVAADTLDLPIRTAHPGLVGVLAGFVAGLRTDTVPEPYQVRVRRWLAGRLAEAAPATAAEAARALLLSERTLHRRLAAEGTTFRAEYATVRRELAVELVRTGEQPIKVIATLVGFADQRAFQRAYLRWTGTTPGRDRGGARLAASP
jgi:AraC-like DNA-binding protein